MNPVDVKLVECNFKVPHYCQLVIDYFQTVFYV